MENVPGERRAILWAILLAGIGMFPVAGYFYYYNDWPAVFVNLFGGACAIGFAAYRLIRHQT